VCLATLQAAVRQSSVDHQAVAVVGDLGAVEAPAHMADSNGRNQAAEGAGVDHTADGCVDQVSCES
jgi:hypothetical protein